MEKGSTCSKVIGEVFDITSREWRGRLPKDSNSVMEIKNEFSEYNAREKFDIEVKDVKLQQVVFVDQF